MPTTVQFRRGTEAQNNSFTGNAGELSYDTTNKTIRAHDGATAGGSRLATYAEVNDRIQVANAAAIYATKAYAAANTYVNAQIGASNTNIRSYTDQTFETKSVALSANNAQNSLILDRLQIANASATFSTLTQLGNTNSYIATKQDTITGGATSITSSDLTASRALVSDGSGKVAVSAVTSTELGYLDGVTSSVQAQVDDRLQVANASATFSTLAQLGNTNSYIATKLDSSSYTASDVLTKIKTVDGAASGLDADLLDGQQGTYYLDWTNVTNKPDPVITLGGDLTGSVTLTNVTSGTLTAAVVDDSHNHSSSSGAFTVGTDLTVSGGDIILSGTGRIQGIDTVSAGTDAANKTYVDTAVANIVDTAPEALNTLNELAAALGDDANFATTTATSLGTKAANTYVNATFSTLTQLGNTNSYIATKQDTITGGATSITSSNLTASRALVSDGSGKVAVSAVTSTELGYLDGVTSAIQTQLNAKQATITGAATSIDTENLTVSRALVSDGSGKVGTSAVTSTELGYLDGVTSAIQTQLNGKQASGSYAVTTNNLSDLSNAGTARTNLGLGSLATLSTVNAATITDNSVGAAELNVTGNGTTSQFLRSDGDGTFTWATPTDTNTTYTGGTGITLTGTTFSTTDSEIVHDNLSGFVANEHINHSTVSVTAGSGLTGGGTIAATRTINVGAGSYITVAADSVSVDATSAATASKVVARDASGDFAGNIITAVDFNATSDVNLKENIATIEDSASKVSALRGVSFDWKKDGRSAIGVIAQEVEEIVPEVVSLDEEGNKGVNYGALVGLLIEAVKTLQDEVDKLKQK